MYKLIFILPFFVQLSAFASDYPPNYVIESQCVQQRQVRVCANNQNYGHPYLYVEYLGQSSFSNVFVKLNGKQGNFKLNFNPYASASSIAINALRNVRRCYKMRPSTVISPGEYQACPGVYTQDEGLVWYSEAPSAAEQTLFYFARQANGTSNDWDLELAFSDDHGHWDSNYGANYKFRFNRR